MENQSKKINQITDTVSTANQFEKENMNKDQIYLLKTCSNECIKDFNTYNLSKKETECMNTCFKDYLNIFFDAN